MRIKNSFKGAEGPKFEVKTVTVVLVATAALVSAIVSTTTPCKPPLSPCATPTRLKPDPSLNAAALEALWLRRQSSQGLSWSSNLGHVDIWPLASGKQNAGLYVMDKIGVPRERAGFLCDDDNDIGLAEVVQYVMVPAFSSPSFRRALLGSEECQETAPDNGLETRTVEYEDTSVAPTELQATSATVGHGTAPWGRAKAIFTGKSRWCLGTEECLLWLLNKLCDAHSADLNVPPACDANAGSSAVDGGGAERAATGTRRGGK